MEELKKGRKYLPIGTVVMLKGGEKRIMITGFCAIENGQNTIWDYNGCIYPEGILNSNEMCLFNHSQIDKVYHMGLKEDDEEKKFKKLINKFAKEIEEEIKRQEK